MTKCDKCGDEMGFDENWTEEDAKREYQSNFPNDPDMRVEVAGICDDCYHGEDGFKKWLETLTPEQRAKIDRRIKNGRL